jgi:hypothetical protein
MNRARQPVHVVSLNLRTSPITLLDSASERAARVFTPFGCQTLCTCVYEFLDYTFEVWLISGIMKRYQKGIVAKSFRYTLGIKITQYEPFWSGTTLNSFAPFFYCESCTRYSETLELLLRGVANIAYSISSLFSSRIVPS